MKFTRVLFPAALTLASGIAFAQEIPSFSDADTDGNGVLSHTEARDALPGVRLSDQNGDGVVNRNEVVQALPDAPFDDDDEGEVGSSEYDAIVRTLER